MVSLPNLTLVSSVIIVSAIASASAFVQPQSRRTIRPSAPHPPRVSRAPLLNKNYAALGLSMAPDKKNNDVDASKSPGLNIDPGTKLLLCILIDFIGVASFAAPGVGEATDVAWAPISAVLVNYLFGNGVFTALAFAEELLPGFDIIPTATIAWFVENGNRVETTTTAPPPPPSPAQGRPKDQAAPNAKSGKRPYIPDAIDVEILD
jgi:hypothetical protein